MKNIEAILTELGVEVPEDKKATLNKAVSENYKTINDWQNQRDKVEDLSKQLSTTKEEIKKFEGVNAEELKEQISKLNKQLADQDTEYKSKLADRDFQDLLGASITEHKGINAKAIKALLDMDALKSSKNQKADIDKAVAALVDAEDSKMLFGGTTELGKIDPIGKIGGNSATSDLSKMRSVMGLPPENNKE